MRDFLEKKDKTKYDIIHYIYSQDKRVISIDDIVSHTQLSPLKVNDSLKELLSEFIYYFPSINPDDQFHRDNYNQIIKGPQFSLDIFLQMLLKKSIYCEFLLDLFFDKKINHETYSFNYQLSLSTIKREWRYLKSILRTYDISIIKEKGLFTLVGNEDCVRYLYFKLFMVLDFSTDEWLTCHNLDLYKGEPNHLTNEWSIKLANTMLYVCISRAKKKHFVVTSPDYYDLPDFIFDKHKVERLMSTLYEKNGLTKDKLNDEVAFFYFFITTRMVVTSDTIKKANNYLSTNLLLNPHFIEVNELVNDLIMIFDLKFSPTDYFYLISNFILTLKKNIIFKSLIKLDMEFESFKEFPTFKTRVTPHLSKNYHITMEQIFIILYPILERNKKPLNLMIISRFGLENKKRTQNIINDIISSPINFVNFLEDKPDLIITDVYFDTLGIPYYLIKPYPTLDDFILLGTYVEEHFG